MSFEVLEKDLLGRIGKLKTKQGAVETPLLLPVVNPMLQIVSPKELAEEFGCRAVITNAYLLRKNFGRLVVERGVHDFLGFDHTVVTDSGAYQILVYGDIEATQSEIIAYEEAIDTDVAVILDIPTGGRANRVKAEHTVKETLGRAEEALKLRTRRDMLWVGPVQGGNHLDLVALSAREIAKLPFDVSFLFGGQIKGERLRLFMIYSAGNFIECTTDTPYLQIGEHKYGKPVLDRAVTYGVDLYDTLKIGLISMDSTMRSNLAVGMPIDILVARRDVCDAELSYRIEPGEPYFPDLRERWSAALRAAHIAIPRPPYANPG